ncbi:DNA repair rad5 [Hyphodiscus hymeniophilus]|uniref:DNA repair rad5 n=1 Tax=Hyphodiscus hymeniophilus TaxID=353542 RepID=A0A9P6SL34_9HELO|nr:DNA repair rad5 [Hyphodiscus hymeniophilus]
MSQIEADQPHSENKASNSKSRLYIEIGLLAARKPAITEQKNTQVEIDSDDDFEEIEAGQASGAAQDRWKEKRPPIEPHTPQPLVTRIKTEPVHGHDSPNSSHIPANVPGGGQPTPTRLTSNGDMPSILAIQRALIEKTKAAAKEPPKTPRQSVEGGKSRHTTVPKKRGFDGNLVIEDPEEVEAAMRAGSHEDNEWMHDEPEDDSEAEMDIIRGKIQGLARKEKNGKINENEMFDLNSLRMEFRQQQRLKLAAKAAPSREREEETLFVPDERDNMLIRKRHEQRQRTRHVGGTPDMDWEGGAEEDGEEDGADNDSGNRVRGWSQNLDEFGIQMPEQELDDGGLEDSLKKTTKARKPRKKVAKDAREVFHRKDEKRREKERSKAQKAKLKGGRKAHKTAGKGNSVGGKKGNAARNVKAAANMGASFNKFTQADGLDEIGQMMIDDLFNNDPIIDRLQNPIFDVMPEPEMQGNHVKQTQLQRLLANIPQGSNIKEARSDKAKLQKASKCFGFAQVKAVDGKWLINGMKSTLYHHQLLGAQWMIERELGEEAPHGGLLADGMGLGKTVQTLACMVGNQPEASDCKREVKATLIVVPSSVIDQWMDEIRVHVDARIFPKIMRYKTSYKIPVEVLRDLDIVVTSYHDVMRQYPYPDAKDRERIAEIGYEKWWRKAQREMGDLFGVYWYRVILDEAHTIKNNQARTSLACQSLRSVFRWCLTGTPLLNRIEELFPYLRFLKANYSMDWKTFQRYFCDPDANECQTRIATLLSYTMMRRTMKTTILNRPIIILPKPHPEIRYLQFSSEERIIYRITENRFRALLNVYLANGTANKNYAVFLVQLLRLRQCTSHPFMLERTIKDSWTSSDLKELKRALKSIGKFNKPFYEQCEVWVTQTEQQREAARARGEDPDQQGVAKGEGMPFGASDFGHSFKMGKALKTLSQEDMYSRVTCALCSDIPSSPMVTDCNHIFCSECLSDYMNRQAALNGDDDVLTCPACEKIFSNFQPYKGLAEDDDRVESEDGTPGAQGSRSKKRKTDRYGGGGKGADALGFEPKIKDSTWVDMTDNDQFPLLPSAKMVALKALLLKGFHDAPTDKVVIYVQFRLLAKIIGRICQKEGWGFLYLTGDCSLEHRSRAIKKFRDDDYVQILIAGLKCGGLGLNFPWANRCISLDLWWNHAVEQQAFGRIFRIGQKKETHMTRLIVKNTVDVRLLSMQLHKLKACETAMRSGEEKLKPSLNLHELARLFGFLRTNAKGDILEIQADYVEGEGEGEGEGADGARAGAGA